MGDNDKLDAEKLATFVNALLSVANKQDQLKGEASSLLNQAEDCGFDRKALKLVVRQKRKGQDPELARKANAMFEALGDLPLFAAAM